MTLDEIRKELDTAAPDVGPAVGIEGTKVKKAAAETAPVKPVKPCGIDLCKYSYGVRACNACIHRIKE